MVTPPLVQDNSVHTTGVCGAIIALGAKYQIPVVDLPALDGLNATYTYCPTTCTNYTLDGVHPQWFTRQIMGRILSQAFRGMNRPQRRRTSALLFSPNHAWVETFTAV